MYFSFFFAIVPQLLLGYMSQLLFNPNNHIVHIFLNLNRDKETTLDTDSEICNNMRFIFFEMVYFASFHVSIKPMCSC